MGAAGTLLAPPAIGSASGSDGGRRLLLKGGIVLTLDRSVGDFDQADVLIEDGKIKTVARTVQPDGAQVIDCLVGVNLERLQRRAEGAREALLARSK
jgi:hypothetical protein